MNLVPGQKVKRRMFGKNFIHLKDFRLSVKEVLVECRKSTENERSFVSCLILQERLPL